jgi:hypothetical protein
MKKMLPCVACNKKCLIANVTLYQTHWYVEPYSCNGGDYWNKGECQFVCHHCNVLNRLLYSQEYDYSKMMYVSKVNDIFESQYMEEFRKIIDTYDESDSPFKNNKWMNNYWINTLS